MSREERIQVNGLSLWTARQGRGDPLVICHGGPGAYDTLEPVAEMLDDRFTVLRYDQRGSGRSSDAEPYTVATFIEDLEALRAHFGWSKWVVLGHSWGADLGLIYALNYPRRTKALVYLSGTGIDPGWHQRYRRNRLAALSPSEQYEFRRLTLERERAEGDELQQIRERRSYLSRKADAFDPKQVDLLPTYSEYRVNFRVNQEVGADYRQHYEEDPDFAKRVAELSVPLLALHGEGDPRDLRFARALAHHVKRGEFRVLAETGHFPWIEQPERLRTALRDWLISKQSSNSQRNQ